MIRPLTDAHRETIRQIINAAAARYQGAIPDDCYQQPYMSGSELRDEMAVMSFSGYESDGQLIGVMAIQEVADVTLIRHAYVLPEHQGRGVGGELLRTLIIRCRTPRLLLGTWAGAEWAIRFYLARGFRLLPDKDEWLQRYWTVPARQRAVSVVLGIDLPRAGGTPA